MSKKCRGDEGGGDAWLNTYADMVTLLLTFFAVLLSMSNTDEAKFNAFIQSFSNLPPEVIEEITNPDLTENPSAPEPTDMEELYQALSAYVQQNNQEEFVSISKQDGVIYIRFSSSLFFLPDEYVLRPESIPVLSFIGDGLKSYEDKIRMVNVIGYTATVDNGTYWRLSGERAATVATHFNFNCHFNPQKLTVIGYGNQYPVAPNDTEENRKKNRRVELIIIGNESATDFDVNDALGNYYDPSLYPTDGGVNDIYLPTDTPPPPQTKPLDSNGTSQQEPPPNHVDVGVSPYTE